MKAIILAFTLVLILAVVGCDNREPLTMDKAPLPVDIYEGLTVDYDENYDAQMAAVWLEYDEAASGDTVFTWDGPPYLSLSWSVDAGVSTPGMIKIDTARPVILVKTEGGKYELRFEKGR